MPASIATLFYAALILGLFWLDRDHRSRASAALWIPVIWLSLAGSRSVSEWLHATPPTASMALYLEGDPVNRLVYSCLVASGLVVLLFRGPKVFKLLQSNAIVVVFLLYSALSLTWADHPDVGFKRWVKVVGDFVMVLIVVSDRDPSVDIRRLLARTGFLLIPLSVLMIKYYPNLARYYDAWDWSTHYSGVTTNKNALGAICLLFGLASAWQFLAALNDRDRTGQGRRLIAHGVMLAMVIWLFRFTNSMTALSCFLLGLAVLLGLQFRSIVQKPFMVHALVGSLIAAPGAVLFMGLGAGLLKIMGRDPTLTDRTQIWDLLLALTTNTWFGTWFGTGFENFWLGPRLDKIWSMYRWGPAQAHNGYIEIFLNLGWIGIALLAVILLIGYRTVIAGLRRSPSTGSLMLAYFVVGIVYNFTEAAFFRISAPVWFALLLVITKVPIVVDTAPDLLRHSFRSRSRVPGPRHRLQPIRS